MTGFYPRFNPLEYATEDITLIQKCKQYARAVDVRKVSREEVQMNSIDVGIKGNYREKCFLGLKFGPGVPSRIALRALLEKVKSNE